MPSKVLTSEEKIEERIKEKTWYIFKPEENRKFKKVDFSEIPENPGFIFLTREIYKTDGEKRGFLKMFSPYGKTIKTVDYRIDSKESVREFDEKQQEIVNLALKLSK